MRTITIEEEEYESMRQNKKERKTKTMKGEMLMLLMRIELSLYYSRTVMFITRERREKRTILSFYLNTIRTMSTERLSNFSSDLKRLSGSKAKFI